MRRFASWALALGLGVLPAVALAQAVDSGGSDENTGGLLWTLARTFLVLTLVIVLVYVTLNFGLRRLMGLRGLGGGQRSAVVVLERIALDPKRTLFVLKAGKEFLLVAAGEAGMSLLTKLDPEEMALLRPDPPSDQPPQSPFLQRLLSRRGGSGPPKV